MAPGSFRIFLASVVVVHHSFPLRLGNWAVGMFFILSGYWISKMWRRKYSRQRRPYRTFVVSRWWRLAPLFLFVQFFGAALVWAGFQIGDPSATTHWQWWVTQPPIAGSTQYARLLPPSWSLDVEMQFYLLAPLLIIAAMRTTPAALIAVLIALFSWSAARLTLGATTDTPRLDIFLWLFMAGTVCEQLDFRPSRKLALASTFSMVLLVTLAFVFPSSRSVIWFRGADAGTDPVWANAFFLVASLVALPAAIRTVHMKSGTFDRWLGDLSYPLYLCHWFSRDWYYGQVDWGRPAWQNGLWLIANFAIAFAGAVALLHLIDRPAQRFREHWMTSRSSRIENGTISTLASQHA